jgi:hypothetical protein
MLHMHIEKKQGNSQAKQIEELQSKLLQEKILNYHILGLDEGVPSYPMNFYHREDKFEDIAGAIRQVFIFKNRDDEVVAKIFQQTWFAGEGHEWEAKDCYVGLLPLDYDI